ncbi:MAG: FkbM family methyltransferase [Bacteroidota bacterium]|nr:FkbM family methyltransferase [Bacteroidota bacterium]
MLLSLKKIFKKRNKKPVSTQVKEKYPFVYVENENQLKFCINNSTEEFRLVRWGGEEAYVKQMIGELKTGDIFFDIGSSVGLVSVMAAQKLTNGTVVSFEPDPENLMRLKENFALNTMENFMIRPIAIGDRKTVMHLYTGGSNNYSPSLESVNGIKTSMEVEVDSIDNLLERKAIPLPTVIKIDIEGAELMALKGMKKLLSSVDRPRVLFIELHPEFLPSFNATVEEIFDFLSELKYDLIENTKRDQQILCKLVRSN